MVIRKATAADRDGLMPLVVKFREELAHLRAQQSRVTSDKARAELQGYFDKNCPVFIACAGPQPIGFITCKIVDDVVWAETMYVLPEHRRNKIATRLFEQVEQIAREMGGDTVYNWVHPNNDAIIGFLAKRGYDVLNLIEVRKPRQDETNPAKIRVGKHAFKY
jgi:ribosomal protein S18 acetylase RimI-like enzyme